MYDFTHLTVVCETPAENRAAELFSEELRLRTGAKPEKGESAVCVVFRECGGFEGRDSYRAELDGTRLTVSASCVRGLIYGYSLFLRRTMYNNGTVTLIEDISGTYSPDKRIRGHQLGYRTTPNTYDAWSYEQYFRYYLDMMMFGCNICEHIPYEKCVSKRNSLMQYDEEEFLVEATRLADSVDMDVSLWFPNCESETDETAAERRVKLLSSLPRANVIFPPGGDPGSMYADDFIKRCEAVSSALKKAVPGIEMWPSAQKPHEYPDWGYAFTEEMEKLPESIDGFIMGPNHAFPIHELRSRIPAKYPMRFYPDITHNVRCEYPVHYTLDDWHFALSTALGRESVNPRPAEFRTLHRATRGYVVGSVSYSEGVHDDVNKMLWSDMDFFPNSDMRGTLLDYARAFLWEAPAEKLANAILMLEQSWNGDPAENPVIDCVYSLLRSLEGDYPALRNKWRFNLLLFRACCDKLVRERRTAELALIRLAVRALQSGDTDAARAVLSSPFSDEYTLLREYTDALAGTLFEQIGIQLDVKRYGADSWERGATLETLDLPVTDRAWLLNRLDYMNTLPEGERGAFIKRLLSRNDAGRDGFYYSLALHGFDVLGERQQGEFYIDFQGDRPNVNNGSIPMSMLKIYDNYSLRAKLGGFASDCDYVLTVAYCSKKISILKHHRVIANGVTIYDGPQFGGEPDERFDRELLAPGFESASYIIPREVFKNGTLELFIGEEHAGVMLSEFWIRKHD